MVINKLHERLREKLDEYEKLALEEKYKQAEILSVCHGLIDAIGKLQAIRPNPTVENPQVEKLTMGEFSARLPSSFPLPIDVYVGGGLAVRGYALRDIDVLLKPEDWRKHRREVGRFFEQTYGKPVEVLWYSLYPEEPSIKIYGMGGKLVTPSSSQNPPPSRRGAPREALPW